MQTKTFNLIILATTLVATILPLSVWYIDSLDKQTGMFPNLLGVLALMTMPILWIIGNVITGVVACINHVFSNRFFMFQCAVSVVILIGLLIWQFQNKMQKKDADLRNQVVQAIKKGNLSNYKQALQYCGSSCINLDKTQSVTKNTQQYDEAVYKDWLIAAVAAQSEAILVDILADTKKPRIALAGSGAPYLTLNYSCSGYFLGEANVYQIAVLQKTPEILKRLIANTSTDEKDAALWYAAQANRIDYVKLLLTAGASRNIKDEYGVKGVQSASYSLIDAAVEGFALQSLQWLLDNGFDANGQLGQSPNGQAETLQLKHTPLHTVIYMAQQEQDQFNSQSRSIQMWKILKKAGADDTTAKPQSVGAAQTPLQFLLESNVYDSSAAIVQAFVAQNISQKGLTDAQQIKLQVFLSTKPKTNNNLKDQNNNVQIMNENCGENYLRAQYNADY